MAMESPLVQLMVWCQTDTKSLPEPLMDKFTDAYKPQQSPNELTI